MFPHDIILVVPCYNEEKRLDLNYFDKILLNPSVGLLFVNDGSSDSTKKVLTNFVNRRTQRTSLLNLDVNLGKANAVRIGLITASETGSKYVGYLDADGAFPIEVISNSLNVVRNSSPKFSSYWFSRVKLAGSNIERNWKRHYVGRIVVTFATNGLKNCPYDTQSGFKIFLNTARMHGLWSEPFQCKWLFDIEIFIRLSSAGLTESITEIPINEWRDVAGSKIKLISSIEIFFELLRIFMIKRQFFKSQIE